MCNTHAVLSQISNMVKILNDSVSVHKRYRDLEPQMSNHISPIKHILIRGQTSPIGPVSAKKQNKTKQKKKLSSHIYLVPLTRLHLKLNFKHMDQW